MYIGEQLINPTEERLRLSAQFGVENVVVDTRPNTLMVDDRGYLDAKKVSKFRKWVEGFDHKIDAMAIDIDSFLVDTIRNPERAKAIGERLESDIVAGAEAGIPILKYNIQMVGITRTGFKPGRGGVRESTFCLQDYSELADKENSYWGVTYSGEDHDDGEHDFGATGTAGSCGQIRAADINGLSEDQVWSALDQLVNTIVPIAESAGVRLACHPHDPAYPVNGLDGICHVVGTIEGMERLLDIAPESDAHGLNFCQGTIAEMSRDPSPYVVEAIRRIGARNRINMVHFRNIKGGYLDFSECFPDDGDVDMAATIRAYREVGYEGILCPDHVPLSDLDPSRERFFAFALGYTKALLQTI